MTARNARHAAIILAAGASRRLGTPKQLLRIGASEPLLRRAIAAVLQTAPSQTVTVLGANADEIASTLTDLPIKRVDCGDWQHGMSASLRAGIAALADDIDGALIVLCDQPDLSSAHLQAIVDAWRRMPDRAVASRYAGTLGVPALLPRTWFGRLQALRGDHGARDLLRAPDADVIAVDAAELARDIDTPADL